MNIESKEKELNNMAEAHEKSCPDCYAHGGMVTLCPANPKHPQFTSGKLSEEAEGSQGRYSKGGVVKDTDSGSPTMNAAAHASGEVPKSPEEKESNRLDDGSLAYENSQPASLGSSKNSPIGDEQMYDGMPPVANEEGIMESLSDKAMRLKYKPSMKDQMFAEGGKVERNDSVLEPLQDDEASNMRFISSDTNDFKDRDDALDPLHDAGAVDEKEDESLSGMAMRKRKAKR